ncbi:MAG: DoxX family protein [Actinopolymorphaceae bacterium]
MFFAPLGIAAAIGLVRYFVGAVGTRLHAREVKGTTAPAFLLIGSIAALVLRLVA